MAEMQQTADRVVVIGEGRLLGEFDLSEMPPGTSLEDEYLSLTAGAVQYRAGTTDKETRA